MSDSAATPPVSGRAQPSSTTPEAVPVTPEVAAYIDGLVQEAARVRLPQLFGMPHPDALYYNERHGVTTTIVRTPALAQDDLVELMKYRLAQYAAINFVDPRMIWEEQLVHEPLSGVLPDDVHVISGSTETGEILCYCVMKSAPDAPHGTVLRHRERPLFPVEKVHGWGIYNRLAILPDLPYGKLRELGRFVKNQRLHTFDELGARAPVEVGVALFRTLSGPLRLEVDAIVGDLEEGVARQNLDFFHAPLVVLHGTVPYEAEASYFFPRYQYCTVYPFAALATDISQQMLRRLDAIEAALEQPGKAGLLELFRLKRERSDLQSSLIPPSGIDALSDASVPQQGVAMASRQAMLDLAGDLRRTDLFSGLSVAEATVLGTFMVRQEAAAGEVIVRQGELGDAMYLIESGNADVRAGHTNAQGIGDVVVATLGPGDFFGEIALLTGAERIADVVAATPLTLLRLDRDDYTRYLTHAAEVERQMTRAAMTRTHQTSRRVMQERSERGADGSGDGGERGGAGTAEEARE